MVPGAWTYGVLSHVLTGLDGGRRYDIQVRAVNGSGPGPVVGQQHRRPGHPKLIVRPAGKTATRTVAETHLPPELCVTDLQ